MKSVYLTSDLLTVLSLLQLVLVAASAVPESSAIADQPHILAGHLSLQIWNNLRKTNHKSTALRCMHKHSENTHYMKHNDVQFITM